MAERAEMRRYPRVPLEAFASVTDGSVETSAIGLDASPGGLALRAAFLWQPGARVTVRMRLQDATCALARAVVERVEGDTMGLKLLVGDPGFLRLVA